MRIVVSAGGTMGHINPALKIIEEFQKNENHLEVIYIGTHNRMEKDIIPKKGYTYVGLEIYGFSRSMSQNVKNIFCIQKAIKKCKDVMRDFKPDVVIGVGGYVTYPVLKAAHDLHIKTFIHEQNSIPGKSNKMIGKYADLIGITFKESEKYFKTKGKIVLTGHPSGDAVKDVPTKNKESLGLDKNKKLVTVVAGSLGSGSLNDKMTCFLKDVQNQNYEVVYITGKSHYESFCKEIFPKNVFVFPYMEELPGLLKISDIVISRAGAGSLSEILALRIPSIIIPSPNVSNNHQYYNAKELSDKKCIYLLEEKDITKDVLEQTIDRVLNDKNLRLEMTLAMQKSLNGNSSAIIYKEIKELIK